MATYTIQGGKKLSGEVTISGNKNSVLPCMAACLLTEDEVTLKNVPGISDVSVLAEIMRQLGSEISQSDHSLTIKTPKISSTVIDPQLSTKLRAAIVLAGPLLARSGNADFAHPGGDTIGKRSIDTHLNGFKQLGYSVTQQDRSYNVTRATDHSDQQEITVFLDDLSVTATENLIMAAVLGNGKTILKQCAQEPHIVDLCTLLIQMGADIEGIGNSTLIITAVEKLHGTTFSISPEHIEIGTYAVAAAITGGEITMHNASLKDLVPMTIPLRSMGIELTEADNSVTAKASEIKAIDQLKTRPWPGFPTDLMSVVIVLATQARGISLLHDWMYESRMFFVDKLIYMGAQITIADPHRVLVYGPSFLRGRDLETPDIRAGMALVLAALTAEGASTIYRAELIERGYEDVVGNLKRLGANIERAD